MGDFSAQKLRQAFANLEAISKHRSGLETRLRQLGLP